MKEHFSDGDDNTYDDFYCCGNVPQDFDIAVAIVVATTSVVVLEMIIDAATTTSVVTTNTATTTTFPFAALLLAGLQQSLCSMKSLYAFTMRFTTTKSKKYIYIFDTFQYFNTMILFHRVGRVDV